MREVSPGDLPVLTSVYVAAYAQAEDEALHWDYPRAYKHLERAVLSATGEKGEKNTGVFLVLKNDGLILGGAFATTRYSQVTNVEVFIHPGLQNRGLGSFLISKLSYSLQWASLVWKPDVDGISAAAIGDEKIDTGEGEIDIYLRV